MEGCPTGTLLVGSEFWVQLEVASICPTPPESKKDSHSASPEEKGGFPESSHGLLRCAPFQDSKSFCSLSGP